uniref:Uncharacterized protein n=1 Tax=Gouania willdenowi TaxID=441366 RepID=A0A8C5DGA2_GOUWI
MVELLHLRTCRCAVLRENQADQSEIAKQVVKLLTCESKEVQPTVPVLLMIDDFEDEDKVSDLQELIETECEERGIQSSSALVLLLNCRRSESSHSIQSSPDTVFIGNDLSAKEQTKFEAKLREIKKTHKNADTFYGFMIMKENFQPAYIQSVERLPLLIHWRIAKECLNELSSTHNMKRAEIVDILLNTDTVYGCIQGTDYLLQELRYILVNRQLSSKRENKFSPFIEDIARETPGLEESVLENASKRFEKDAVVCQLLARYNYLRKKNFREAKSWAKKARDLHKDSSYFADTSAQVIKHELKNALGNIKEEPLVPEKLQHCFETGSKSNRRFQRDTKTSKERVSPATEKQIQQHFAQHIRLSLKTSPVFSAHRVRHDIMSQVLAGKLVIEGFSANTTTPELNLPELLKARQFLEMEKVDSYTGILSYLSESKAVGKLEECAREYEYLCARNQNVKDCINCIYVSVVLSCTKRESKHIPPYQVLLHRLQDVLRNHISLKDSSSTYFIAVVLLWPCPLHPTKCESLEKYISLLRSCYHDDMKEVYCGKWPVLHFFLGKKTWL